MKNFVFIITVLSLSFNIEAQQLHDIASEQGIVENQNFSLSNANGMSFYDFDEDGWDDLTYPMHNDSIIDKK